MSCLGIKSSFSWLQTWKYLGLENLHYNKDKSKISYYRMIIYHSLSIVYGFVQNTLFSLRIQVVELKTYINHLSLGRKEKKV